MAVVHFRGENESLIRKTAQTFHDAMEAHLPDDTTMLNPAPSMIPKVKNKYRYQICFTTAHIRQLSKTLRYLLFNSRFSRAHIEIQIDIDPQSLL